MDKFASKLPKEERTKFMKTWASSICGGAKVNAGSAFNKLLSELYWDEEKIKQYKEASDDGITVPAQANNAYSKEQLEFYNKGDWAKLCPLLDAEQWNYLKNQMLYISREEDVYGFLYDLARCFSDPEVTQSINELYGRLQSLACPTSEEEVYCYISDAPNLLAYYRFCYRHLWWHNHLLVVLIIALISSLLICNGNKIARQGSSPLFRG